MGLKCWRPAVWPARPCSSNYEPIVCANLQQSDNKPIQRKKYLNFHSDSAIGSTSSVILVDLIFIFNLEKSNHAQTFEQFASYSLDVELSQCSEKSRNEEINESPWVDPATSQKATRTVWLAPLWHKVQQMWYCTMTNIPFLTAVLVMLQRWILRVICFSYTCNVCTSKESASIYSSTSVKFLQPKTTRWTKLMIWHPPMNY